MKRKKKAVYKFMRWLEGHNGFKLPPTTIAWNHPALLVDGDKPCFGVTVLGVPVHICVAGKVGKKEVMRLIAHEYKHYTDWRTGRTWRSDEEAEAEAESFANSAVEAYLVNIRVDRMIRKLTDAEVDRCMREMNKNEL